MLVCRKTSGGTGHMNSHDLAIQAHNLIVVLYECAGVRGGATNSERSRDSCLGEKNLKQRSSLDN